jgi:hypothetical protein
MDFLLPKFLHIGSMFMATALAVGPVVVVSLILRSGDGPAIRRAFAFAEPVARAGAILYALGIVFGVIAALTGSIDLTASWLLTAYVLVILLGLNGVLAERWMRQVHSAAERSDGGADLEAWRRSSRPIWSGAAAVTLTLAVIFVMVVKPTLF